MTDKQTDVKTYNCVYCNKTLTKFETQPLYKDGEFLTTCEECWYKHAKEEGYVVSDVQTINITIDDLINGNLRDMEITAQFGVYRQAVKGLDEQLKAKEEECERLKNELLTYGATGICEVCTDKSVLQNDKYTKALREIKEIAENRTNYPCGKCIKTEILQKCEVINDR